MKLWQKGTLLVSVPLIFELAFVLTLVLLQRDVELAVARESRSREIISLSERILERYYAIGVAVADSMRHRLDAKKNKERVMALAAQIPPDFSMLHSWVVDNPRQLANVEKFEALSKKLSATFTDFEKWLPDEGDITFTYVHGGTILQIVQSSMDGLVTIRKEIVSEENERRKELTRKAAASRRNVAAALYGGIALNVALSLALAAFFSKSIVQRVAVIASNAHRLAEKTTLVPAIGGGDEIGELDTVFHDMANKLTEAAKRERAMIDNAADVICSISKNCTFAAVSHGSIHNWHYQPEELIGQSTDKLIASSDAEQTKKALEAVAAGSGSGQIENRITRNDGSTADMLWSVQWSQADQQFFCVVHDITDRKKLDAMKQDFVNMVSHDLRAPVLSIQAFLNVLSEGIYGKISEKGIAAAGQLEGAVVRLVGLINNLLDIEKMEAGKLDMRFGPVDVQDIVGEAVNTLKGYADVQKVAIDVSMANGGKINGDKDRLVQVVVNLLSNAIKFSPPNTRIGVRSLEHPDAIEVQIADQGRGIPAQYHDTIFDKFAQMPDENTSKRSAGSGLGLAICKAIVEEHHGTIGVTSESGTGSTFWFRLPRPL
jgi:PAS domain S-box-containing protein